MPVPTTLTKEEALRQIAELQRHVDSLPKNNHPLKLEAGMVFKKDYRLYVVHRPHEHGTELYLVCLGSGSSGLRLSVSSMFGCDSPDKFEYLGMAEDVLCVKAK